tara:strand:- start:673 stop:933 length:261 start_codon:yes stop_codon:yes gene_type:complete
MKIEISGVCRYISKLQRFDGHRNPHKFKIIVIETLESSYIAIHAFDDNVEKTVDFVVGEVLTLQCTLESHKNRKNPDLWYHKILLQ